MCMQAPATTGDYLKELFSKYAGSDGVVDARELRDILNEAFRRELKETNAFEQEACRSLLAMMDVSFLFYHHQFSKGTISALLLVGQNFSQ